MKSSSYRGFYKLPLEERLRIISEFAELSDEESNILRNPDALPEEIADHMVENVIGRFTLPMGVGINFKINGKEYMIPMVTEEPSVIAAASNAAKMARDGGGFHASYTGSIMISQIQITDLTNPNYAAITIQEHKEEIIQMCNDKDPVLVKYGGGVVDVETRVLDTAVGKMLIVHLKVNTLDAMGANAVNTMAESVAPYLEEITGGRVYLRILSNLAVHRLARARVQVQKETLGEGVVDAILRAYAFAEVDPFRAATHNKGIMNGVVPVVLATGNDTRAIESGAHAYASITGTYKPLTVWEKDHDGNLVGTIELPMAVGLVGGATKIHPQAQVAVKMLGVKTSSELAMIIASVGLAQNLAALKVLATEGVQRGHMSLHARNLATTVGAKDDLLEQIVSIMIKEKNVRLEYAEELFNKLSTK
ncbi:hydroxymethylglutaryl-CoA reductase, degradative [Proteiniclasticum ruminis]|uniref:3-hydroxy-3-methylglutaryl coenzyme A reductase n=1 Tax=Proteiniclasticum ruminis TaxID=398199 RepID=A0A1G8K039_9CLOT|nr:hydroxymethylglutaryl-CoA reductase, degradative [Proteiniclasticum ruminis]SDI36836.1 hydroxymethylglutaryl-CoA reductase [Proteiniclasticum ruminis]